jgi:hypothetical protein
MRPGSMMRMLVTMSLCDRVAGDVSTTGRAFEQRMQRGGGGSGVSHLIGVDLIVVEDGADAKVEPHDRNQDHRKWHGLQAKGALFDAPHIE